jgi:CelD/BcsL family acetyltransferase involved in cellulose biosynthesis
MHLTARVATDIRELASIQGDWASLLERSATNVPTMSPMWLLPWWETFGGLGRRSLRAVLFFEGARLVGLAPLLLRPMKSRIKIPFRRLELLGSGEDEADEICSDYIGVLAEEGSERAVAEALATLLVSGDAGRWDELSLRAMDGDGPLPLLLAEALRARGAVTSAEITGVSHYIRLPSSWETYLDGLSSTKRYLIRRSLRDFEHWAKDTMRVERARLKPELPHGMRILEGLHAERWSERDAPGGVFGSARFRAFHQVVAPSLLDARALDLIWITAHGRPVVAAYNLVWNKRVYFYQSGRALDVPRGIRPGIVLHALAIRAAIEASWSEYDFLAGNARYKSELAASVRPLVHVHATRPSIGDVARRATELAVAQIRALRFRRTYASNGAESTP